MTTATGRCLHTSLLKLLGRELGALAKLDLVSPCGALARRWGCCLDDAFEIQRPFGKHRWQKDAKGQLRQGPRFTMLLLRGVPSFSGSFRGGKKVFV